MINWFESENILKLATLNLLNRKSLRFLMCLYKLIHLKK